MNARLPSPFLSHLMGILFHPLGRLLTYVIYPTYFSSSHPMICVPVCVYVFVYMLSFRCPSLFIYQSIINLLYLFRPFMFWARPNLLISIRIGKKYAYAPLNFLLFVQYKSENHV